MPANVPSNPGLWFPKTGTEFQQLCDQQREYHHRMYDAIIAWTNETEKALRKVKGNPWLAGIDMRIQARRTVRPLFQVAERYRKAAQGWVRLKELFEQNYTSASSSGRHSGGHRIDVTK